MSAAWLDRLGGVASLACALHCAVFGLAPALVTLVGLELFAGEAFEWGFFALALVFATLAAALGYRAHRTAWVPLGFALGGGMLVVARLAEALALFEGGAVLAVCAGLLLVGFHVANTLRMRACEEACCP
jgi:hypothetical protein